jgi:hypothetical protein
MDQATVEYSPDALYVLVRVPKCLLVFTKAQWVDAMRRGKSFSRYGGEKPGSSRMGGCDPHWQG